jgi:hypothetical protein
MARNSVTYDIMLDPNPIILDPTRTINLQYITEEEQDSHFNRLCEIENSLKKIHTKYFKGYIDMPIVELSKKEFEELRRKSIMETWENIINGYEQENKK